MKLRNAKKSAEVQNAIIEKLVDLYEAEGINEVNELNIQEDGLTVILFVGVNGVGKTTSIGKLAHQFKNEGKSIDGSSRYLPRWSNRPVSCLGRTRWC